MDLEKAKQLLRKNQELQLEIMRKLQYIQQLKTRPKSLGFRYQPHTGALFLESKRLLIAKSNTVDRIVYEYRRFSDKGWQKQVEDLISHRKQPLKDKDWIQIAYVMNCSPVHLREFYNPQKPDLLDHELKSLELEAESGDWDQICERLNQKFKKNESPFYYFSQFVKQPKRREWTPEELQQLIHWHSHYEPLVPNHLIWVAVSSRLPHRSAAACKHKFHSKDISTEQKGKWTKEETDRLVDLVSEHGLDMTLIKPHFPNRTVQQIKGHWTHAQPDLKKGRFTPEETLEMVKYATLYGTRSWVRIAEHMPGRTGPQLRKKFGKLSQEQLHNMRTEIFGPDYDLSQIQSPNSQSQ